MPFDGAEQRWGVTSWEEKLHKELYDVAVVGYGPTGMVLASLLGSKGHRVIVLERWPSLYGKPRLTHIDGETARLLSFACNIEEALEDSSSTGPFEFKNAKGATLLDVSAIPTRPMGFPAHISVHQPDIETALDRRIRSIQNVAVVQGAEVVALEQGIDTVTLTAQIGSVSQMIRARYVFGADGARSFTRQSLGISRTDFGFNERWLNVDCERKRPLASKFDSTTQYCDPARGYMFMPIGTKRQRFEFAVLKDESTDSMEAPSSAWAMLQRYHGLGPDDLDIIRQIVYTFECRLADKWRSRRVLLGGDAAHTMPPYLGQGACSGIRDAANLAWKLDLVLRGVAADTLLDAYETERRDHVVHIMKTSRAFGKVANTHSKTLAFIRDLILRAKLQPEPPPFPPIRDGVVQPGGNENVLIGRVPPQGCISVGGKSGRLDAFMGYNFAILSRTNPLMALSQDSRTFLEKIGCAIFTLSKDASDWVVQVDDNDHVYECFLDEANCHAMMTRPDGNVYGFSRTREAVSKLINNLKAQVGFNGIIKPNRTVQEEYHDNH